MQRLSGISVDCLVLTSEELTKLLWENRERFGKDFDDWGIENENDIDYEVLDEIWTSLPYARRTPPVGLTTLGPLLIVYVGNVDDVVLSNQIPIVRICRKDRITMAISVHHRHLQLLSLRREKSDHIHNSLFHSDADLIQTTRITHTHRTLTRLNHWA